MMISEQLKAVCIGMQRTAFLVARMPSNVGAMQATAKSIESDAAKVEALANLILPDVDAAAERIQNLADSLDAVNKELFRLQVEAAQHAEQVGSLQVVIRELHNENLILKEKNETLGRAIDLALETGAKS